MHGGAGNDTYFFSAFNVVVEEGDGGVDTVVLRAEYLDGASDYLLPEHVENMTMLGEGISYGNALANIILGSAGWQYIVGGDGDDTLEGAGGHDWLHGGPGADRFVFRRLSDSLPDDYDSIFDFSQAQGDRIDVSAIDADVTKVGNNAFTYIGSSIFTGKAGQLRVEPYPFDAEHLGHVEVDVNGDGVADLRLSFESAGPLVAADFIL